MNDTKVLSQAESIRVKTAIADEWRKAEWEESHPSTQIRDDYYKRYLTDIAVITGLLIEAISRLAALMPAPTQGETSTQAPAPTSARDSTVASPVVWKATDTP